jgi:hypothetical protein
VVETSTPPLAELKARGVPVLDETPRIGAGGCRVAFVHPRGAAGVLLELKEAGAMTQAPRSFDMGDARVTLLQDGTIALDGGAMFGVVPRVVWEKRDPPDERNRVTLGLNVALIESGGKRVLVDTGMGERWTEKEVRMYRIDRSTTS